MAFPSVIRYTLVSSINCINDVYQNLVIVETASNINESVLELKIFPYISRRESSLSKLSLKEYTRTNSKKKKKVLTKGVQRLSSNGNSNPKEQHLADNYKNPEERLFVINQKKKRIFVG